MCFHALVVRHWMKDGGQGSGVRGVEAYPVGVLQLIQVPTRLFCVLLHFPEVLLGPGNQLNSCECHVVNFLYLTFSLFKRRQTFSPTREKVNRGHDSSTLNYE